MTVSAKQGHVPIFVVTNTYHNNLSVPSAARAVTLTRFSSNLKNEQDDYKDALCSIGLTKLEATLEGVTQFLTKWHDENVKNRRFNGVPHFRLIAEKPFLSNWKRVWDEAHRLSKLSYPLEVIFELIQRRFNAQKTAKFNRELCKILWVLFRRFPNMTWEIALEAVPGDHSQQKPQVWLGMFEAAKSMLNNRVQFEADAINFNKIKLQAAFRRSGAIKEEK